MSAPNNPAPRRVTAAELARELNVSRQVIHHLEQRGTLSRGAGRFDLESARQTLAAATKRRERAESDAIALEREAAEHRRAAEYAALVSTRISLLLEVVRKCGGDPQVLTMGDIAPLVHPEIHDAESQGKA